jgi:hypothetical protein
MPTRVCAASNSAVILLAALFLATASTLAPRAANAQYPGKITKSTKDQPVLRSIAVLEWTGDAGKPSASRLVPVAVFDGTQLNDGAIYLNRPEPLALENGVEYELQIGGKPAGIYDVFGSSDAQGAWDGFGVWRPLSAASQKAASAAFNTSSLYASGGDFGRGIDRDTDDDKPVLKRKHPKEPDSSSSTSAGSSGTPTGGAGIGSASTASSSGSPTSASPSGNVDPDRPTLKKKSSTDDSPSTASTSGSSAKPAPVTDVDPDRPTLRRSHKSSLEDADKLEGGHAPVDPDRPRLKRGKPADLGAEQSPALVGYPPSLQQAVAVSDAVNHTEHPWKYTWADPADELKMKSALEDIARAELGLNAQQPPAPAKPARKTSSGKKVSMLHDDASAPKPQPVPLADEHFQVFELTYGGSATMVLTAASPAPPAADASASSSADSGSVDSDQPPAIRRGKPVPAPSPAPAKSAAASKPPQSAPLPKPAPQKFVTLIAQPDLYGGVLVIYKSITDAAHLDEKPRLRLVDAVDAMGDNRGELLFELHGAEQRQFALFRVLRGSAQQLFATVAIP